MATLSQKISLMEQRMNSMENKMDKINDKLDMITERLLDPDSGVAARVNRNTSHRKLMGRALWVIYVIVIGVVAKLIWNG